MTTLVGGQSYFASSGPQRNILITSKDVRSDVAETLAEAPGLPIHMDKDGKVIVDVPSLEVGILYLMDDFAFVKDPFGGVDVYELG